MALVLHGVQDITIDRNGDLSLRFYKTTGTAGSQFCAAKGNRFINGRILATMLVSRMAMAMAKNSSFYRNKLTAGSQIATQMVLDINDPNFLCAELWLRAFHDVPLQSRKFVRLAITANISKVVRHHLVI